MPRFFDYFDFELQLSPFVDVALLHIPTPGGRTFHYKDGLYAAGIEALIFPAKWRSIYVRVSLGVDLVRTFGFVEKLVDTGWRQDGVSKYELFIGIGLHY
jgi:hypothetical protein